MSDYFDSDDFMRKKLVGAYQEYHEFLTQNIDDRFSRIEILFLGEDEMKVKNNMQI